MKSALIDIQGEPKHSILYDYNLSTAPLWYNPTTAPHLSKIKPKPELCTRYPHDCNAVGCDFTRRNEKCLKNFYRNT